MARIALTLIFAGLILVLPVRFIFAQTRNAPEITFGDILGTPSPSATAGREVPQAKADLVKKLIAKIEANGAQSLNGFYPTAPPGRASVADSVADYFITPIPTLNPRLSQILADSQNLNRAPLTSQPTSIGNADKPGKTVYSIAVLGDSMTDTMGENLYDLKTALEKNFPGKNFALLNYGQGATNIEQGLYRLTNPTRYLDRDYPPLVHLTPDIVVIESFAYNHWAATTDGLNRQWIAAVNILDTLKKHSPATRVILLATVSPNARIYGDGKLGLSVNGKWDSVIATKAYLQNFINFAESSGLPLADAYHASLTPDGQGDPRYIDSADNLHPSAEGRRLVAEKIAAAVGRSGYLE